MSNKRSPKDIKSQRSCEKPKEFKLIDPGLHAVAGDATHLDSFVGNLEGQDAVVFAVGVSSLVEPLKPMTFRNDAAVNIVEGMKAHRVQRLIWITSVGVHNNPKAPLCYKALVHPMLLHKYEDMQHMEAVVRDSGLEWTIIRPASLNHEGRTGSTPWPSMPISRRLAPYRVQTLLISFSGAE